nr:putative capsid protein [Odonata-associated circular virus-18]
MAYRKKKTFKRKRSFKRPSTRVSKKVKRFVKKYVDRQIEDERVQTTPTEVTYSNTLTNAQVISLMPSIGQGVDDSSRTGNVVRLRKAILRLSASAFDNNIHAHWNDLYIFKQQAGIVAPTGAEMNPFLDNGSTAVAYAGHTLGGLRPVNPSTSIKKLHNRTMMASVQSGGASGSAIGSVKPCFTMTKDITSFFKKRWVYEDSTLSTPNNDNVFIGMGGSDMTGQIAANYGEYSYSVDFFYEDA